MPISWDKTTEEKFHQLIAKIPGVLQAIAKDKISKKAEILATQNNKSHIGEKEMVDAFFAETPFGFHGPMKMDMESLNIDYTKYGHPR